MKTINQAHEKVYKTIYNVSLKMGWNPFTHKRYPERIVTCLVYIFKTIILCQSGSLRYLS